MNITTAEMEVAIIDHFDHRNNIIVPNLWHGIIDYEADVVSLTKSNFATEIEIKISKQDLLADFKKNHNHDSEFFKYFYYAVPEDLVEFAMEHIPKRAGILSALRNQRGEVFVYQKRRAELNRNHRRWTDRERLKLAELGTMRIFRLKRRILELERNKK